MPRAAWIVAHAKSDFFTVLDLPVRPLKSATGGPDGVSQIVLSHETWIRDFDGAPNIAGSKVHVGNVDAIIVGIAFGGSIGLPGNPNAWLLGSDPEARTDKTEFVVGHLSPIGYFNDGRWVLSVGGIFLGFLVIAITTPP